MTAAQTPAQFAASQTRLLSSRDISKIWSLHYGDTAGPSDAARLRSELTAAGTDPDAIGLADVRPFYDVLSPTYMTTDCARGAALLPPDPGPRVPLTDAPVAVIVESRPHPLLPFVVGQVRDRLGLPVQIFHAPGNADFIHRSSIGKRIARGEVHLSQLASDQVDAGSYNGLLLSRDFHERMIGRGKILIFQTDAMLCPGSPWNLRDFQDFDYIGALSPRRRHSGAVIDGGIGGFSLRDWRRSVECLERFPPANWIGAEDDYYGFHIALTGGRVATQDEQARFAAQGKFRGPCFAAHRPFNMHDPDRLKFLLYCPRALRMMWTKIPQILYLTARYRIRRARRRRV